MSKCDVCKYQDRSDSVGGMYLCEARNIFADLSECSCFKKKPMTNADRIRSMTDEELLDVIECIPLENCLANGCHNCISKWIKECEAKVSNMTDEELADIVKCPYNDENCSNGIEDCYGCTLEWLQQESEETENV